MHYKTQKSYYKNSIFLFPPQIQNGIFSISRKFKQVNFSISRKFIKIAVTRPYDSTGVRCITIETPGQRLLSVVRLLFKKT